MENPFVYQGYENPDYFCDRTEETENILSALRNGRNITLISPRKIGKTGLINHAFYHILEQESDIICIYIDIFSTNNLMEFVETISKAVIEDAINREKSFLTKVLDFFKGLRPTITPDLLTGMPTVSVSVVPTQADYTLKSIFAHLEGLNKRVYLAIDEFQQVSHYAEIGADAFIRSIIQFVPNVHIIFSGSQQHLLADMFMSPGHPFFNSSQIMTIGTIDANVYRAFANNFFAHQKREMSEEAFDYLYDMVDGQTWYVQKILNRLYRTPKGKLDQEDVFRATDRILHEQEINYQSNYNLLTDNQAQLLTAIACEGKVNAPTSLDFILRHQLPAPSSIKMALKSLQDKEFLFYDTKQGYIVYDRFFGMWLKRLAGL